MDQIATGPVAMPAVRRNRRRWTIFLAAIWASIVAWSSVEGIKRDRADVARMLDEHRRRAAPVTQWFDVRSIYIDDAIVGTCPTMHVDRSIYERVRGTWVATVRRRRHDGRGFAVYESATGTQDYQPDAAYPEPLDLAWWMNWRDCSNMRAGTYILTTQWIISPIDYPPKEEFEVSNVFVIKPREIP